MKRSFILSSFLIFVVALSLRSFHLVDRAPFDWDQNRDYSQVLVISGGEHTALGPVAKGSVGGFYLGSLYYYLLLPAFTIMSGALDALPMTSIIFDSLVAGLIYLLFSTVLGKRISLSVALLWSVSWFLIESSRVSWNVALIPIWTLLTLYSVTKIKKSRSTSHLYLLAFLGGLTFHIHLTLIAIFPFLILIALKSRHYKVADYLKALGFGLLPLIPLIHYDLTHAFKNLRLVRDFFATRAVSSTTTLEMIRMVTIKLGKVTRALYFAKFADSLVLGTSVITLSIASLLKARPVIRTSALMILLNIALIILFRDYNFPGYYLAASYLPIYLVGINFLFTLASLAGKLRLPLILIIVISLLAVNLRSYSTELVSYSLGAKQALVSSLIKLDTPLDIHLNFDPGRDGGIGYLISRSPLLIDPNSSTRVILTDKVDSPAYIEGELCEDLLQLGNMKSALDIVQ